MLRRRVEKLAALLRLALALLRTSGFRLSTERLPNGPAKPADPSQRRSSARMSPVARGPRVPGSVAESVSRVAPTADRVLPRRSVIVSSHLTASTDARRDSRDRRHGDLDRLPPRADRHAGGPRAAGSDSLSGHAACTPWNGENSRDRAQNVRVDSSVRPRGKLPAVVIGQALVPRTQLPPQHPILFDQVRQYLPLRRSSQLVTAGATCGEPRRRSRTGVYRTAVILAFYD